MNALPQSPRQAAEEALGEPVAEWIDRHRIDIPGLSYRQIADLLAHRTGVRVNRATIRAWHTNETEAASCE